MQYCEIWQAHSVGLQSTNKSKRFNANVPKSDKMASRLGSIPSKLTIACCVILRDFFVNPDRARPSVISNYSNACCLIPTWTVFMVSPLVLFFQNHCLAVSMNYRYMTLMSYSNGHNKHTIALSWLGRYMETYARPKNEQCHPWCSLCHIVSQYFNNWHWCAIVCT